MNKRKTKHSAPSLQTKLTDKVIDAISSSRIDSQKNSNATHKSSFQTYGFSSLTAAHMHKESAQFSFTKNTESHMKKRKRKKRCNRHKPSARSSPINRSRHNVRPIQRNAGDLRLMSLQRLHGLTGPQVPNQNKSVHPTGHNPAFWKLLIRRNPSQWPHETGVP